MAAPPVPPVSLPPGALKPVSENPLVVRLRNELLKRGGGGIKGRIRKITLKIKSVVKKVIYSLFLKESLCIFGKLMMMAAKR